MYYSLITWHHINHHIFISSKLCTRTKKRMPNSWRHLISFRMTRIQICDYSQLSLGKCIFFFEHLLSIYFLYTTMHNTSFWFGADDSSIDSLSIRNVVLQWSYKVELFKKCWLQVLKRSSTEKQTISPLWYEYDTRFPFSNHLYAFSLVFE